MLSCSVKADDFSDKQVILTFIFLVTDWIGLVSGKMMFQKYWLFNSELYHQIFF